jgi:GTP pyrophosphokinase
MAKLHFTFEMGDPAHLGHVVRAVQRVDGVFDAHRVTGGKRTDG